MTADPFLEAIQQSPDDDGLRLVYADYLEEHGDPRGEFIRVQCALAHLPANDPRFETLKRREQALWEQHGASWTAPLAGLVSDWECRRGFVEKITVELERFLDHADLLRQQAPLSQVEVFHFGQGSAREAVAALAASPALTRVVRLDLQGYPLGPHEAQLLARSPYVANVQQLDLRYNTLGDDGVRALAGSPYLNHLTSLYLAGNWIGDEGVRCLAASLHLPRLHGLDLGSNSVTDVGLEALAHSPLLVRTTMLDLSKNLITDAGAVALARSPRLGQLKALDLSNNYVRDAGVQALARCPALAALAGLDLHGNFFTSKGSDAWLASSYIGHLASPEYLH
jgi:uncharacterized protein (TIGR02996 family)